jgi:hypothetical protein
MTVLTVNSSRLAEKQATYDIKTVSSISSGNLPFAVQNTTVLNFGKYVLDSTNKSIGAVVTAGAGSAYFNGSSTIETAANTKLGFNGAFTVEGWYKADAIPQFQTVFELGTYQDGILYRPGDQNNGGMWIQNSQVVNGTTMTQAANVWYHFAIVRDSSNNIALFVNGNRIWSASNYTSNINSGNSPIKVGGSRHTSGQFFTGYIGYIHILKGINLYNPTNTTITKPTQSPTIDPTYTSVLLCNNKSSNVDSGPNNLALTISGTPTPSALDANNTEDLFVGYNISYSESVQPQLNSTTQIVSRLYSTTSVTSTRAWYDIPGIQNITVVSNSNIVPFDITALRRADGSLRELTMSRSIVSQTSSGSGTPTLTQYWY